MQDGLEPIYLFPDGQHDQPSRMLHPAEEFYRLRGILRDDPRALDDQCELFCACPLIGIRNWLSMPCGA